jgi:ornithine cyclodeaminase/alanine dehydrogenase-like protein (mu-crystallin family)
MPLYLTERDVTELLQMADTLAAVEAVFKAQAAGTASNQARRRVRAAGATLNVMSAAMEGTAAVRAYLVLKAYTVTSSGARFHVSLYDAGTGELLAFIEADRLGQMRTGAASGIATKYLAREDAHTVAVYGTGWQARSQLAAVCAVRSIRDVRVYSRRPENRERFCAEMAAELHLNSIRPVDQPEAAAEGADIIITITSARNPVVSGEMLGPGVHINAAGGNSLLRRELDDEAITRASSIIVDSVDQARIEAGELLSAVEKGLLTWERVRELRQIVSGEVQPRRSDNDITIFKSLGLAIEDLAAAAVVYERALERKLGKEF